MVSKADNIETGIVGESGMPEHLSYLVDAVLQTKAEEDLAVGNHQTIQSETREVFPQGVSQHDFSPALYV